jgi:hypothetical protein
MLGEAEARYGAYGLETLPSGRVACALSVGSDPTSPAMAHKGNPAMPNEDALRAIDAGDRALLAVADAHYGTFARPSRRRTPSALRSGPFRNYENNRFLVPEDSHLEVSRERFHRFPFSETDAPAGLRRAAAE